MKGKKTYLQVRSKNIYHAYELLLSKGYVSFPLTNDGQRKVEAIVANINGSNFGIENYKTTEEKAVAYLYFLIKGHPFTDGNKRTASLVFEVVCDINNLTPHFKDSTLDQMAVFIENVKEDDHQDVIKAISSLLFEQ